MSVYDVSSDKKVISEYEIRHRTKSNLAIMLITIIQYSARCRLKSDVDSRDIASTIGVCDYVPKPVIMTMWLMKVWSRSVFQNWRI